MSDEVLRIGGSRRLDPPYGPCPPSGPRMFDFYPRWEATFAQVQLVLFMLGMGATLGGRDFVAIVRRPGPFVVAFLGHVLLMPLIAVAVNAAFGLADGIALGLVLTAAMPGGALSKAFTYLGRG